MLFDSSTSGTWNSCRVMYQTSKLLNVLVLFIWPLVPLLLLQSTNLSLFVGGNPRHESSVISHVHDGQQMHMPHSRGLLAPETLQ